ncbi:MAG: hypothetical protein ACI4LO_02460 [Anaerovoracaceae bacterium]
MNAKENRKLGIFNIAFMYVGAIMGAGFASGREIWQFFGVFGSKAYIGIVVIGIMFMLIGLMTSKIARTLDTNDMGKIIVPGGNKKLTEFMGYFMAVILFTVLISMSAAGGALFHQQFGLSRVLGGALIVAFVILTVIGGFDRVSGVFRFVMPVLMVIVVSTCLMVIFMDLPQSGIEAEPVVSPLTPNWFISAMVYISYNVLSLVPIAGNASRHAKSEKQAVIGVLFGSGFLGLLAMILGIALFSDPGFSQTMDMPMLAYSAKIAGPLNVIYTCVMLFAIYATATSNFYGFTTKIKDGKHKNIIIIAVAWIGFALGLMGFKNVIAYVFPLEGFIGFAIIAMIAVNFYLTVFRGKKCTEGIPEGTSAEKQV